MNLGVIYQSTGEPGQALVELNRAIELDPTNADAYYDRAVVTKEFNLIQSEQDYLRAIELNPRYHQALLNLANFYSLQRNFDEALQLREGDSSIPLFLVCLLEPRHGL